MQSWNPRRGAGRVVAMVAALVVTTAQAAEWEPVGTDADGNAYAVDKSRMARDGATVSVTVRTEYAQPRRVDAVETDVFAALDQLVVDCGKATFALQSRTYVAADGTELPRGSTARADLRFRAAAPGSMSDSIVRYVCKPGTSGKGKGG